MSRILLSADWTNLLVVSFETNKELLAPYIPAGTELDDWNGKYFLSLVGFEFSNTRLLGIPAPFYRSFPELNLRFYVKRKYNNEWRKGVVFIKEIAPSKLVGIVAGLLYRENFKAMPIERSVRAESGSKAVEYSLYTNDNSYYIKAHVSAHHFDYGNESLEQFISDRNWGYTRVNKKTTLEFEVSHRPWLIYPVISAEIKIDGTILYGTEFKSCFKSPPYRIFLMDGSETGVSWPYRI